MRGIRTRTAPTGSPSNAAPCPAWNCSRNRAANDGVTGIDALLAGRPQPTSSGFALYRIGDAVASRNIHAAVPDAPRLCQIV